jgi:hypothetical protein
MAAPYNVLRSKLNRALVAYLVNSGAGGIPDIFPGNSVGEKSYPNTVVLSTLSRPEIPMTGIRRISVHISIKGSATQKTNAESNPEQARVDFDNRCATTYDALMQTVDGQTLKATAVLITAAGQAMAVPVDGTAAAIKFANNNADMADFTCQEWYDIGEGDGEADAEGCSWEEILMFEAVVSGSAIPGY